VKQFLKRVLSLAWQRRLRGVSRFRWLTKYRILGRYGVRIRDDFRRNLSYVLWDPELESYSYELDNEDELVRFAADLLGTAESDVARHLAETKRDPELNERLALRTRWRFDTKTCPPPGNRLLWYVIVRWLKPRLIVETGIYDGLGSLVLLRALERNAEQGVDGRLVSIDVDPKAGRLVDPRTAGRWRKVVGTTSDVLARELEGKTVEMLIHDTPHLYEIQRLEFGCALEHGGKRLVLIDGSGGQTPALRELCEGSGAAIGHFNERPHDHFYTPAGTDVCVIER
jgi:Methyltransferase domain